MAGRPKDSVKHFVRLAERRLSYAEFLHDALLSGQGTPEGLANLAVENAAMAVECALKGLLLASTQASDRSETEASFRGTNPHRFEWLTDRLKRRGLRLSRPVLRGLSRLGWWEHERRYELGVIPTKRAAEFLSGASLVVSWVRERI